MRYRLIAVTMVLLAGCANAPVPSETDTSVVTTEESTSSARTTAETQPSTSTPKGSIRAQVVDSVPSNATVVSFSNETLRTGEYRVVRNVVEEAVRSDSGFAQQNVRGDDVEETMDVMQEFPYYEGSGRAGVYIENNGTVVEVLAYRED